MAAIWSAVQNLHHLPGRERLRTSFLVLARLYPDAPPWTESSISLFIVPKFLVNDDGSLGARTLICASIEY